MAFSKMAVQPGARAADLLPDEIGPGLYPGEVALQFGAAQFAAVGVDPKWERDTGGVAGGVTITARARYIKADGTTKLTGHDEPLEVEWRARFSVEDVKAFGVKALAKEVALVVLGEPPQLMRDVPIEGGGVEQHPVLNVSDSLRANVSLREAVLVSKDTAAAPDTGAILGL
jgi:hypothetical protein